MNPSRNFYFLRQKEEELKKLEKEQELKQKELQLKEYFTSEMMRLMQIKHDITLEHLRHEMTMDKKLHEEQISYLEHEAEIKEVLHQNQETLKAIEYQGELNKKDNELDGLNRKIDEIQHLYKMLEQKNSIIKEQNVAENKRGQIIQSMYNQLYNHIEWKGEYLDAHADLTKRENQLHLDGQKSINEKEALRLKALEERLKAEAYVDEESNNARYFELKALEERIKAEQSQYQSQLEYERHNLDTEMREKQLKWDEDYIKKRNEVDRRIYYSEKERYLFYKKFSDLKQDTENLKEENQRLEEERQKKIQAINRYENYKENLQAKLKQLESDIEESKSVKSEQEKSKAKKKKKWF